MNRKIFGIAVFLLFVVFLSGCGVENGIVPPETAELNISIDPNPVPYSAEDEEWQYAMTISESNGVGVTISSLRFDLYDSQEEELIFTETEIYYEEDITDWFGTNYIPAFSSIQDPTFYTWEEEFSGNYDIVTVSGTDDNGNPVEATARIDYLPQ